MNLRRVLLPGFSTLVPLIVSCSNPVGCDPCSTEAIAYGLVTDTLGEPVPGVRVKMLVSSFSCEEFVNHGGTLKGEPWTDDAGWYRAVIVTQFKPFTASCLQVIGNSHEDPAWPTTTVSVPISLEIRPEGERMDSVRVDVVLRAETGG